eukprot:UN12877
MDDVNWSDLSLPRYYVSQLLVFTAIRGILFPNVVVKTHIQLDKNASKDSIKIL